MSTFGFKNNLSPQKVRRSINVDRTLRNSHPFVKGRKENFPSLEDAFQYTSPEEANKLNETGQTKKSTNRRRGSSNLFLLSPEDDRKDERDKSVCSYASTFYDDVSINLSIGGRAALAEHRHYISNHGIDDEFVTKANTSRLLEPEDVAWDTIMDGESFHESSIMSPVRTDISSNRFQRLNYSISRSKCASTTKSFCDTSDYFNSSRVHNLFTPERNKPKVDEANRLALMGEGTVNERCIDYDHDVDESHIAESECVSDFDERYLAGMLSAAARISTSDNESSPSKESYFSFCEDQKYSIPTKDNNVNLSCSEQPIHNSFEAKVDWDDEADSDVFQGNFNDENVMPEGAFSEIGASFLEQKESSFIVESESNPNTNENGCLHAMTPISKRQTSSYFATPPMSSPKNGSPSQFNYLGISPMHGGLHSSVLETNDLCYEHSPISSLKQNSIVGEEEVKSLAFDSRTPVSSIMKKSSSFERLKDSSISTRGVSFSVDEKPLCLSSKKKTIETFNAKNARAVCFDYGVEIIGEIPTPNESFGVSNKLNELSGKQHTLFTPDTEDVSLSPSNDYESFIDENPIESALCDGVSEKMKPKSLLKSFETNVNLSYSRYQQHSAYLS